jgi:ADP-ribosylglycohydrolase
MTLTTIDRTVACLKGIATGDAIGKQTENLSREDLLRWYPQGLRGFEGTPGAIIPRYIGNAKRQWRIGETTDDTERTIAVARAIIADRNVSHVSIGREMLGCSKSVHPGVRSLWEFHQAGDPAHIARAHDGCGAAIRVAPVGILHPSDSWDLLVNGAYEASISTHGGSLAIAAAAATAAAVSAAIDGATPRQVLERAERAAALAECRWPGPGRSAPVFAGAIRAAHDSLAGLPARAAVEVARRCFPDQPLTIVPLALGLATVMQSAEDAILLAANVGGDSDSVASIAGGILGAMYPSTVNEHWCQIVENVNHHDLARIGRELARLRQRCPPNLNTNREARRQKRERPVR